MAYSSDVLSKIQNFIVDDNEQAALYRVEVWNVSKNRLRYQKILPLSSQSINIYPTIVQHQVFVDFFTEKVDGKFSVLNNLGQRLVSGVLTNSSNQIDLSTLPPGVYFINVENAGELLNRKLLKAH